ncbi:MAG TPA: tetratricopeptide repeat protein [Terriglobales bacterium]|jgi:tetratricopeptide (TPR) repeat protein|nr:tetratricopeptide repeat protein [Terriglobales bacterium]
MKKSVRVLALMAVGLMLLSAVGCDKLRARDQLNKGVASYKNARYEEAIAHFQQAVTLDPSLLNARLYLATAYAQQYIPGVDAEDNNRLGQEAIEQYKAVLERDPKSINSVKGIAYICLQMKKFEDAKSYYRKALEIDPNDPEPYYSVGVIDWTQTYQPRMEERAKLGMKPDEQLNPKDKNEKKACEELKQKNSANIQDGIDALNKALQLRADYDDAMAYMNLMYRERADVECDDLAARAADLKTADEWVDKTMATKKAKAEKQPGAQGITMDQPK